MSGFSNPSYLNEKGEEVVLITAIDPRTSHLKQFERDCYDSGLVAGIRSERERIASLIVGQVLYWTDNKGNDHHPDFLVDILEENKNE